MSKDAVERAPEAVPGRRRFVAVAAPLVVVLTLVSGCATPGGADPFSPPHRAEVAGAIRRGIGFLAATQATEESEARGRGPLAGDWPHHISSGLAPIGPRFLDTNAFTPALIHHALARITPAHAEALGLSSADVALAREVRRRAIRHILRFRMDEPYHAIGYWRPRAKPRTIGDRLAGTAVHLWLGGPDLNGPLAPENQPGYPRRFQIWPDADTTAIAFVALAEHRLLEGEEALRFPVELFAQWRDNGRYRRVFPQSLEPASGAFLTWFAPAGAGVANDCDFVVNANVLFAHGWFGREDSPGVDEAIDWIVSAASPESGTHPNELLRYYPCGFMAHYAVSKAYREGNIARLRPAVDFLADEIEACAKASKEGVFWESEDRTLGTAYCLNTLLNAGRSGPLIPAAAACLCRRQDPRNGGWRAAWRGFATTESGARLYFRSDAFTTGFAIEALVRYALSLP